jgi:hypothetical protein
MSDTSMDPPAAPIAPEATYNPAGQLTSAPPVEPKPEPMPEGTPPCGPTDGPFEEGVIPTGASVPLTGEQAAYLNKKYPKEAT